MRDAYQLRSPQLKERINALEKAQRAHATGKKPSGGTALVLPFDDGASPKVGLQQVGTKDKHNHNSRNNPHEWPDSSSWAQWPDENRETATRAAAVQSTGEQGRSPNRRGRPPLAEDFNPFQVEDFNITADERDTKDTEEANGGMDTRIDSFLNRLSMLGSSGDAPVQMHQTSSGLNPLLLRQPTGSFDDEDNERGLGLSQSYSNESADELIIAQSSSSSKDVSAWLQNMLLDDTLENSSKFADSSEFESVTKSVAEIKLNGYSLDTSVFPPRNGAQLAKPPRHQLAFSDKGPGSPPRQPFSISRENNNNNNNNAKSAVAQANVEAYKSMRQANEQLSLIRKTLARSTSRTVSEASFQSSCLTFDSSDNALLREAKSSSLITDDMTDSCDTRQEEERGDSHLFIQRLLSSSVEEDEFQPSKAAVFAEPDEEASSDLFQGFMNKFPSSQTSQEERDDSHLLIQRPLSTSVEEDEFEPSKVTVFAKSEEASSDLFQGFMNNFPSSSNPLEAEIYRQTGRKATKSVDPPGSQYAPPATLPHHSSNESSSILQTKSQALSQNSIGASEDTDSCDDESIAMFARMLSTMNIEDDISAVGRQTSDASSEVTSSLKTNTRDDDQSSETGEASAPDPVRDYWKSFCNVKARGSFDSISLSNDPNYVPNPNTGLQVKQAKYAPPVSEEIDHSQNAGRIKTRENISSITPKRKVNNKKQVSSAGRNLVQLHSTGRGQATNYSVLRQPTKNPSGNKWPKEPSSPKILENRSSDDPLKHVDVINVIDMEQEQENKITKASRETPVSVQGMKSAYESSVMRSQFSPAARKATEPSQPTTNEKMMVSPQSTDFVEKSRTTPNSPVAHQVVETAKRIFGDDAKNEPEAQTGRRMVFQPLRTGAGIPHSKSGPSPSRRTALQFSRKTPQATNTKGKGPFTTRQQLTPRSQKFATAQAAMPASKMRARSLSPKRLSPKLSNAKQTKRESNGRNRVSNTHGSNLSVTAQAMSGEISDASKRTRSPKSPSSDWIRSRYEQARSSPVSVGSSKQNENKFHRFDKIATRHGLQQQSSKRREEAFSQVSPSFNEHPSAQKAEPRRPISPAIRSTPSRLRSKSPAPRSTSPRPSVRPASPTQRPNTQRPSSPVQYVDTRSGSRKQRTSIRHENPMQGTSARSGIPIQHTGDRSRSPTQQTNTRPGSPAHSCRRTGSPTQFTGERAASPAQRVTRSRPASPTQQERVQPSPLRPILKSQGTAGQLYTSQQSRYYGQDVQGFQHDQQMGGTSRSNQYAHSASPIVDPHNLGTTRSRSQSRPRDSSGRSPTRNYSQTHNNNNHNIGTADWDVSSTSPSAFSRNHSPVTGLQSPADMTGPRNQRNRGPMPEGGYRVRYSIDTYNTQETKEQFQPRSPSGSIFNSQRNFDTFVDQECEDVSTFIESCSPRLAAELNGLNDNRHNSNDRNGSPPPPCGILKKDLQQCPQSGDYYMKGSLFANSGDTDDNTFMTMLTEDETLKTDRTSKSGASKVAPDVPFFCGGCESFTALLFGFAPSSSSSASS